MLIRPSLLVPPITSPTWILVSCSRKRDDISVTKIKLMIQVECIRKDLCAWPRLVPFGNLTFLIVKNSEQGPTYINNLKQTTTDGYETTISSVKLCNLKDDYPVRENRLNLECNEAKISSSEQSHLLLPVFVSVQHCLFWWFFYVPQMSTGHVQVALY